MKLASQVLKDAMTMTDGESYGIARVLAALASLAHIALSALALMKGGTFDPMGFGTGFAAIIAAGSFGAKAEEPHGNHRDS